MKKIYLLYGPQGSGKSTQAKLLAERNNLIFVSTGEISRNIAKTNPEVKALIDAGNPTPDGIITAAVADVLEKNKGGKGFVFDGYPRYAQQIEPFVNLLEKHQWSITKVVFCKLDEAEGVKRITLRAKTEGRKDDTPAGIARRLELYHQQTVPIVNYFKKLGKVVEVDASGSIEGIYQAILQVLDLHD